MTYLYRFVEWLADWLWVRQARAEEWDRAESAAWERFDVHALACDFCRQHIGLCPTGGRLHREWREALRETEKTHAED